MSGDAQPPVALVITRHSRDDNASRLLAHLAALPSFERVAEIIADPRSALAGEVAGRPVRSMPVSAAALQVELVQAIAARHQPERVIVYSRDELKQYRTRNKLKPADLYPGEYTTERINLECSIEWLVMPG